MTLVCGICVDTVALGFSVLGLYSGPTHSDGASFAMISAFLALSATVPKSQL